jgi:hypothetical protein
MPKHIEYSISRADLSKGDPEFDLQTEPFALTTAKVWVDDVSVEALREKDRLAGGRPQTIAVTIETGKIKRTAP